MGFENYALVLLLAQEQKKKWKKNKAKQIDWDRERAEPVDKMFEISEGL